MASSYLEVGSEGLTELKNDLTNLSKALHELYELMNADMRQVGEAWRDGKYEEFVSGYKPKINKCEEISERYSEWCKKVLDPAIEECMAIETTDVGGGEGGVVPNSGGGGSATANGGDTTSGKNKWGFNMGGEKTLSKAEKEGRFHQATDGLKEQIRKIGTMPSDSGFDTPQNERPRISSQQMINLLNGKQR